MPNSELITKSNLKKEYGLTDKGIKLLGDPDTTKPNPYYQNAAPMALYARQRVEEFIAKHGDEVVVSRGRSNAASKAVETKRTKGRAILEQSLRDLELRPVPDQSELISEVRDYILYRYGESPECPTQKALCSFIRHNYTNYEAVLHLIKGKVGIGELYQEAKVEFIKRIIDHYGLSLTVDEALG